MFKLAVSRTFVAIQIGSAVFGFSTQKMSRVDIAARLEKDNLFKK